MSFKIRFGILGIVLAIIAFSAFQPSTSPYLQIRKKSTISLIGNNLGSRMINFDHFETELHLRYPDSLLTVRNLCDGGDTPGFRPHSSRNDPWVFPGAEKFQLEFAKNSGSEVVAAAIVAPVLKTCRCKVKAERITSFLYIVGMTKLSTHVFQ